MSKVSEIEQLLEKYYNGETSLEEEMQLHAFFEGEAVPDHLKSYKAQFNVASTLKDQTSKLDEDSLFAKIEEEDKVVKFQPWYKNPWVGRAAAAILIIIVSFYAGGKFGKDSEVEQMREELAQMKSLMFEQLNSSSASGRLQAVNNSMEMENPDAETIDVLIQTMLFDESMHVRTAAVEALVQFGEHKGVNTALVNALDTENEPAVQIAIINALVTLKDKNNIDALEQLAERDSVLKEVRGEAFMGVFKLKEL
ncbi:HEAT repeat domain-containing protein [Roseivirga pacifica]|uniref:HEAT repeat domain-containing protein n=1 Tax=Roseivirga pacifica TaxID=1267423 RepID=UPI00227BABD1|nr:HEAT repeat domain-containing protein [Roseivirga pacifica]